MTQIKFLQIKQPDKIFIFFYFALCYFIAYQFGSGIDDFMVIIPLTLLLSVILLPTIFIVIPMGRVIISLMMLNRKKEFKK